MTRWLAGSLRVRPLGGPYFARSAVSFTGGTDAPQIPPLEDAAWRVAAAAGPGNPTRVTLEAEGADVLRIAVRARGTGATRVVVRDGDGRITRVLAYRVASRAADTQRWTEPQWVRVVLPVGARRATVEVNEGAAAIAAVAHRQRTDVLDLLAGRRDRAAGLSAVRAPIVADPGAAPSPSAAASGAAAVLQRLADLDQARGDAAVTALAARAREKDVAPLLRTLALAEAGRSARTPELARSLAGAAWSAAGSAPSGRAAPLLRASLEGLAAGHPAPSEVAGPWSSPLAGSYGAHDDDLEAIEALRAALAPPHDGGRPAHGGIAERYAALHGELPDAAQRARETWLREGVWRSLAPPPGVETETTARPPDAGATICAIRGPDGLRWSVLPEGRARIHVAAVEGTHARVLLRSALLEITDESSVAVEGISIPIHAGAGLASVVAIAPGPRTFERPPGSPPAMALVPREGEAPCRELREIERWVWGRGSVAFDVPSPGADTVARVVVAPARDARQPPRVIQVSVGAARYEAWVRGQGTGQIEVPVPAAASAISVQVPEPMLLRASARLHPDGDPLGRTVSRPAAPESLDDLLARVRRASRRLDVATALPAALTHREERASALDALGFSRFAAVDRTIAQAMEAGDLIGPKGAGAPQGPPGAPALNDPTPLDPALDGLGGAGRSRPQGLILPRDSPAVVPLGVVSRVPPLPLPADRVALEQARKVYAAGDPAGAAQILAGPAASSEHADALLFAVAAELAGDARAADVFVRLGLAHGSGTALAHAASLTADAAAEAADRRRALRAYALAHLAAALGDPAAGAFARLGPSVAWLVPARADASAGTASIEQRGASRPPSLGDRVRRAMLDAPEDAALLTEGERLKVIVDRRAASRVVLEGRCRVLAREEGCAITATVDGEGAPCTPLGPPSASTMAGAPVAIAKTSPARRCAIDVPKGVHRIEAHLPDAPEVTGWVIAREAKAASTGAKPGQSPAGSPLPARVVATWVEIDAARPLELAFAAPTVVRLRARADAGQRRALRWSIAPLATGKSRPRSGGAAGPSGPSAPSGPSGPSDPNRVSPSTQGEIVIEPSEDPTAGRAEAIEAPGVGQVTETILPILAEGPQMLSVASPGGRVLLRVEVAIATAPPRLRAAGLVAPPVGPSRGAGLIAPLPPVGEDPDRQRFTVRSWLAGVGADLTEPDRPSRAIYGELGVRVDRELFEDRAWIGAGTFTRVRDGAPSFGLLGALEVASDEWVPGLFLRGLFAAQDAPAVDTFAFGARGTVGAFVSPRLTEDVTLVPWAGFTLQRADEELEGVSAADRDVYTPYSAAHPRYLTLGLRVIDRPTVDALLKLGASVRSTPDIAGVDRVDIEAGIDLLPGRDLAPWLGLAWLASYRPETDERPTAFLRDEIHARATFWRWVAMGTRLSLGGEAVVAFDAPGAERVPPLSGSLVFEYLESGERGLRDLPPRDTPFRDRLEEGSGRVKRNVGVPSPPAPEAPR